MSKVSVEIYADATRADTLLAAVDVPAERAVQCAQQAAGMICRMWHLGAVEAVIIRGDGSNAARMRFEG